ncbi:hypothetical protein BV902_02720 [Sphingobacterium sp. B29]|uniref:hypothetical protein n=1 Tax=Sphingobacterium sp. B29 TaxID=1933220 RepID=UPI00095878D0|nr:hypothetical protein [Sphingobacterium sp. B29]APU95382.1 hypothetical protein BV902_02720 [Sphingobacterium sp. B29]
MTKDIEFRPVSISGVLIRIVIILVATLASLSFLALLISPQTTVIFQWIGVLLPALICGNFLFFYYRII